MDIENVLQQKKQVTPDPQKTNKFTSNPKKGNTRCTPASDIKFSQTKKE